MGIGFVGFVDQFKTDQRPRGWKQDDFIPPGSAQAWTASNSLRTDFIRWLMSTLNPSLLLDLARSHGQTIPALTWPQPKAAAI